MQQGPGEPGRIDRRVFLTRTGAGALAGGALWAVPQVLTAPAAFAAGSNGVNWTRLTTSTAPDPRYGHAVANDSSNNIVLFGGFDGSSRFDDTWIWDGTKWIPQVATPNPTGRTSPAMATNTSGDMILFGGFDGTSFGDTWIWNGGNWIPQSPGISPDPRSGHTMAGDPSGNIILFGGYNSTLSGSYGDTWICG